MRIICHALIKARLKLQQHKHIEAGRSLDCTRLLRKCSGEKLQCSMETPQPTCPTLQKRLYESDPMENSTREFCRPDRVIWRMTDGTSDTPPGPTRSADVITDYLARNTRNTWQHDNARFMYSQVLSRNVNRF